MNLIIIEILHYIIFVNKMDEGLNIKLLNSKLSFLLFLNIITLN